MARRDRDGLLDLYRRGPELLEDAMGPVPPEAMDYSWGSGRWSIRQILIHVVDADIVGFLRLRKPLAEPGAGVPAFDQEAWAARLHCEAMPSRTALGLFRAFREYNLAYFAVVSESEWQASVVHPERGVMTLEDALRLYANHPLWHIDQITRSLDVWRRADAGEVIDPSYSAWTPPN